jgi:hypothetical protein
MKQGPILVMLLQWRGVFRFIRGAQPVTPRQSVTLTGMLMRREGGMEAELAGNAVTP